jgi:hypothetical protein
MNPMNYFAVKYKVHGDWPPDEFLDELIAWGKAAPDEIFAPNANPADIYSLVKPQLGPWTCLPHRRAVMLEVMRCHACFESSWNWNEGVDTTNPRSMANIAGQETGIFQVSFDSIYLDHAAMKPFADAHNIGTPQTFIPAMKADHALALEYYARLVRVNVEWAGPLLRPQDVRAWLSRSAVAEFQELLAA